MTMFGCIYQLWDWLEAPPLFQAATMDPKKLQQLQQVAGQKKLPLAYQQTNLTDYRTATHSPVFQQQHQQPPYHMSQQQQQQLLNYQQSPSATSSSGGPLSPIDMQPQANKLLLKHSMGGGNASSSSHSSPYHQSSYTSGAEQMYQSPTERTYLAAAGRLQATATGCNPATALQQQYQQLQQAKLQLQMQTQNEALQQQQRTFAMRQALNPPVPQGHYHMSQSSSIMSSVALQQQQQQQQQQSQAQQHQRAPPSTLNLASQFQPAPGPLKVNQKPSQHYHHQGAPQEQQLYAQQQQQLQLQLQLQHQHQLQLQQQQQQLYQQQAQLEQQLPATSGSEQSPVYIQQNHPGHVVNQACQTQISAVKPGAVGGNALQQQQHQKGTPSSEDSSARSPAHVTLDRKKSIGSSSQALRSPITKRPPASPVALSGWLYKQGADGLKVWRKRWFVLAEYCLYYYKGPEEEKLLGSVLLPSYRVSACLPEDKIFRKYAFKCEHQNMRTYWLAAETAESMVQWVRALSAATMMQAAPSSGGDSDQNSQPSAGSSLNHSGENSDSGIHTLQSQQSKMSLQQVSATPSSDNGAALSGSANGSGGAQPLYANAPPKPRRITDGGYSSPSPEHSIDNDRKQQLQQQQQQQQQHYSSRRSGIMSPTLQQMQQQQRAQQAQAQSHHAIYDTRTGNVSTALRLQQQQQQYSLDNLEAQFQQQMSLAATGEAALHPNYLDMEEQILRLQQQQQQQQRGDDIYGERELYMQKLIQQRYPTNLGNFASAEQRTPDAYGRSKNRLFSDYEDIYNLQHGAGAGGAPTSAREALMQEAASYRRPLSPPCYDGSKHVPAMPSRYTPNHLETTGSNINLRARPAAAIVRPHSADFLEYESRVDANADDFTSDPLSPAGPPESVRAPRPKSSLDINRTPDSFYYSEASYAEKMRKSALYLQHPQTGTGAQPQQSGGYRNNTSDFLSPAGSGMHTIGYENPYERAHKRNELLNDPAVLQGASSMPRSSRSLGASAIPSGSTSHIRSASMHPHTQQMSPQQQQQQQAQASAHFSPSLSTQQIIQQNEQFLRSASARLPKRTGGLEEDYGGQTPAASAASPPQMTTAASQQEGERKREESMKRLLEWKQRMLQSPLTRKGIQQAQAGGSNMSAMSKLGSNPNILLASSAVASGAQFGTPKAAAAATAGAAGGSLVGGVSGIQRSRSETHANTNPAGGPLGYNSYSSDDEDGTDIKAPAGRSTSTQSANMLAAASGTAAVASGSATPTGGHKYKPTTAITNATIAIHETQSAQPLTEPSTATGAINNNNTNNNNNNNNNMNTNRSPMATPTPKVLKPILKSTEPKKPLSGINMSQAATDQSQSAQRVKLQLNMALLKPSDTIESPDAVQQRAKTPTTEILAEVTILPKKPAPKSPQITSYVPVYTTKTLSSTGAGNKNYENVDLLEEKQETTDSLQTAEEPMQEEQQSKLSVKVERPAECLSLPNEEDTPMLVSLNIFKEAQALQQTTAEVQSEHNSPTKSVIVKQVEAVEQISDEDEDTACEEYTDDDLDEALAVEADAEDDSTLNTLTAPMLGSKTDLPDDKECSKIYENESALFATHDENYYLPMTPKKSDFGQNITLTLANTFNFTVEEENHYVEMSKGLPDDDVRSNYEFMCIGGGSATTASGSKPKHLQIQSEPVYMELPNLKAPVSAAQQSAYVAEEACPSNSGKSTLKKNKKGGDILKKKSKKSSTERCQSKRKDLPDILKPPQSTLALNSDSSDDADDESSKYIDAKKMRSRTRFSLSDTFRPASYYLGASTPLTNCAESSDSEIVSPPPIPSSPPPMEELKTEEIFSSENYDTVKRRDSSGGSKFNISYEQLPKMHASNTSLNLPKNETALKSSRLSLPDQFAKVRGSGHLKKPHSTMLLKHHERTLSDSNYSFQTDNSSNTSSDFDLYNKLKQNSPSFVASPVRYQSNSSLPQRYTSNAVVATGDSSETDSVEFRHRQGSDSELERQRSRRPLSEESISEIESLNEKFEDALNAPDLDAYLNQLQNSDLYLYQNSSTSEAPNNLLSEAAAVAGAGILTNFIKPPEIFRTKDDEHFYGNIDFVSSTDSLQKLGRDKAAVACQQILANRAHLYLDKDLLGATSVTPTSMEQEQAKFMTPLHSRNNSNISEQSAPYYYSELSSSREMLSTPTTLNNQRDIHPHSGANIAHIHNPIERHGNINVESLADKDQAIDSKNLYRMKPCVEKLSYSSGKNLKTGEQFQMLGSSQSLCLQQSKDPHSKPNNNNQTNLSAYNSSKLTSSSMTMTMTIPQVGSHMHPTNPHIPSTVPVSAARAKNTNVQLLNSEINGVTRGGGEGEGVGAEQGAATATPSTSSSSSAHAAVKKTPSNANKFTVLGAPVSGGELLWEEDTLWRESLRRVSQRHARSLDDLDRIAGPSAAAKQCRERAEHGKVIKLTRDVTYVNDEVSQKRRVGSGTKERLNATLGAFCDSSTTAQAIDREAAEDRLNENDVYVRLMANSAVDVPEFDPNSDVYEVLREETSSNLSSNISHKSTELDRETIRQWDSMSSGLMKNSGSQQEANGNELPPSGGVKSIIQQLNANCEAFAGSGDAANASSAATNYKTTTQTQ